MQKVYLLSRKVNYYMKIKILYCFSSCIIHLAKKFIVEFLMEFTSCLRLI